MSLHLECQCSTLHVLLSLLTAMCVGVGFRLGANAGVKSLVLQLHYGDLSNPGLADTSALSVTVTKKR